MKVFRYVSICLATSLTTALLGCSNASSDPDILTQQEIVIQEVVLNDLEQSQLDERKAAAKAIDQFQDPKGFEAAHRQVLAFAKTLYPEPHPVLEDIRQEIAFGLFLQGDTAAALKLVEDALPIYEAAGPNYLDKRIELNNNLGVAYTQMGEIDKAIVNLEKVVATWRDKYAGENHINLATSIDNLASAYHFKGDQPDRVLALNREAAQIAEKSEASEDRSFQLVTILGNRAKFLGEMFRYEEALATSLATITRSDELLGPDHPHSAYALSTVGAALVQMKQYRSAELNARRALLLREEAFGPEAPETAVARNILILSLIGQNRFSDALPLAEYNYELLERTRGPNAEQTLTAGDMLTKILFSLDQTDAAIALRSDIYERLLETRGAGSYELQDSVVDFADMLVRSDRYEHAASVFENHIVPNTSEAHTDALQQLALLQSLAQARTDPQSRPNEAAKSAIEKFRSERVQSLIASSTSGAQDRTVEIALGRALSAAFLRGDETQSLRLMQDYNMSALSQARARHILLAEFDTDNDRAIFQRIQDLYQTRAENRRAAYLAAARGEAAEVFALNTAMTSLDQQITELSARLGESLNIDPDIGIYSLSDIQSQLDRETLLILQTETAYGLHLIAITAEQTYFRTAPIDRLPSLVKSVREQLDTTAPTQLDLSPFRDFSDLLFDDWVLDIAASHPNILVQSKGLAATVPLSVLRMARDDGTEGWFSDTHAIRYLASLSDLFQPQAQTDATIDYFVGVGFASEKIKDESDRASGIPIYAFRSRGDVDTISALLPLPRARVELETIRDSLNPTRADILADTDFSEADVRALDLSNATVISFATHGLVADEFEDLDEAALVLARMVDVSNPDNDGLLTASEISRLNLSADWVILSACNSAASDGESDEALSGLAAAFINAGAQSLLVSYWPVRDDVASYLTVNSIRYHQQGQSKAKALQMAIRDLRETSGLKEAEHPSIWAPFVIVGTP